MRHHTFIESLRGKKSHPSEMGDNRKLLSNAVKPHFHVLEDTRFLKPKPGTDTFILLNCSPHEGRAVTRCVTSGFCCRGSQVAHRTRSSRKNSTATNEPIHKTFAEPPSQAGHWKDWFSVGEPDRVFLSCCDTRLGFPFSRGWPPRRPWAPGQRLLVLTSNDGDAVCEVHA